MLPIALTAALLAGAIQLPDPTKGLIDGKVAVLVWPRLDGELIEPVDCSAHLIPRSNQDAELLYRCGTWFQPPPDDYRVWIEQQNLISPVQTLLSYHGGPFQERGLAAVLDVVPGGNVQLPAEIALAEGNQLRLLHLDSHLRLGTLGRAFERRVTGANAHRAIPMPAGRMIAAITDRDGNAVALSRPIEVREQRTAAMKPAPPQSGSDVLVVLTRARTASKEHPDEVQPTLQSDHRTIAPDVFVSSADRFYAIWYGVEAPRATLQLTSATMALPAEELKLRPGTVTTLRRTLEVLPSVDISIHAPSGAFEGLERSIDVTGPDRRLVRRLAVKANDARVESLPAQPLRIQVTIGSWRFFREVDLSSYEDRDVVFDLQPIILTGTAYRGRDPVAGTVRFYNAPEWVSTTTDGGGQYQVTLWEPGMYAVEIAVRDDRSPPYRDYFVDVPRSDTHDFHIPDSHYSVNVTNAQSGQAVAGAEVIVTNTYVEGGPEKTTSQGSFAGEDGRAFLPPLRPGSAKILVRARNYQEATLTVPIADDDEPHALDVALRPEGSGTRLIVQFPNGAPCPDAEVIAVANDPSDTILWQSQTEANGAVDVPQRLKGAVLLTRHGDAAPLAHLWNDETATWKLSAPTPPLLVKITDASSEPLPYANMVMWVDGIPLRGHALRFFGGTPPLTDSNGYWRAAALGNQQYELLALRHLQVPVPRSLTRALAFPWPNDLTIRAGD